MIEYVLLLVSVFSCVTFIIGLSKKTKQGKLDIIMETIFALMIVWCGGLILQKLAIDYNVNIKPIYLDYITYVGICLSFPTIYLLALAYEKNNIKFNWKHLSLYIVPIICLFFLWTNDIHHLFYEVYSIKFDESVYGPVFNINTIYSYALVALFIFKIVRVSIKKSGFFSTQTILMVIGAAIPVIINVLGTLKILSLSIYITPMLFFVTYVCYYIAIFKLNAFNVIPVASRTVMDTMSDGYVVISNDGTIADSNKTFREKFKDVFDFNGNENNLFEAFDKSELINLEDLLVHIDETRKVGKSLVEEYHFENEDLDRYFEVDIHPISARNNKKDYIATLLVFKDVTQHQLDIQEIKQKQDIIVKQQQLVSIGELAGGVAHDINTPISAIKTGIVMLNTMSGERTEAEKEIIDRMDNCATKIINIVNSMRNQIRNLGGTTKVKFKVSNVLNDIKVITYHEACKNHSEINLDIKDDVEVMGDPTKLSQVLTNLIVNAIQAYGENGGKIDVIVSETNNKFALINVIDYAGGIDEEIAKYVFKNILTTKGIAGTGLGLYIAYSVIKGEFNGEIDFNTAKGEGTTFSIKIPIAE